ncbi:MAG: NAD-dependent epimerase/dehydratase family protein [Gemmatimonadota bacterium]
MVTGATGFLGRHVLGALRTHAPAARLAVLVRDTASWTAQPWTAALGDVTLVTGSLLSPETWSGDARIASLDGVFHLAAEVKHSRSDTDGMFRTNVEGTAGMVRLAAAKRCRMLFVSTSGAVSCAAEPGRGAFEDAPYCEAVVGDWPYYASKIRAETEARRLAAELDAELVIVRPPVLLGPGDHRFRSTSNVLRLLRGRLPFIVDGGMHFADVRDVAAALVRAMQLERPAPVYHLTGTACSIDEFFRLTAQHAGLPARWKVLPWPLLWHAARLNERLGAPLHILPDPVVIEMARHHWDLASRDAEADLGYRSRSAGETLADTVAWLRQNHPDLRADLP